MATISAAKTILEVFFNTHWIKNSHLPWAAWILASKSTSSGASFADIDACWSPEEAGRSKHNVFIKIHNLSNKRSFKVKTNHFLLNYGLWHNFPWSESRWIGQEPLQGLPATCKGHFLPFVFLWHNSSFHWYPHVLLSWDCIVLTIQWKA